MLALSDKVKPLRQTRPTSMAKPSVDLLFQKLNRQFVQRLKKLPKEFKEISPFRISNEQNTRWWLDGLLSHALKSEEERVAAGLLPSYFVFSFEQSRRIEGGGTEAVLAFHLVKGPIQSPFLVRTFLQWKENGLLRSSAENLPQATKEILWKVLLFLVEGDTTKLMPCELQPVRVICND